MNQYRRIGETVHFRRWDYPGPPICDSGCRAATVAGVDPVRPGVFTLEVLEITEAGFVERCTEVFVTEGHEAGQWHYGPASRKE